MTEILNGDLSRFEMIETEFYRCYNIKNNPGNITEGYVIEYENEERYNSEASWFKLRDGTTYYAIWGHETKITFNVLYGTGGPSNETVIVMDGETDWFYIPNGDGDIPTRPGYTFLGWSDSSNASTAKYEPGSRFEIEGGETYDLYDVWTITENEYHLAYDDDYAEEIRQGLEQKLDALVRHELYAKYKTAPTAEEREQARQAYLDKRGVFPDFRW